MNDCIWGIHCVPEARKVAWEHFQRYYENPINSKLKQADFSDPERRSFSDALFSGAVETHSNATSFDFDSPVHMEVFRRWDEEYRKEKKIFGYRELEEKEFMSKGAYSVVCGVLLFAAASLTTSFSFFNAQKQYAHGVYYQIGQGARIGQWANSRDDDMDLLYLNSACLGILAGAIAGKIGSKLGKRLWKLSPSMKTARENIKTQEQLEKKLGAK